MIEARPGQLLETHCRNVGNLCGEFAVRFNAENCGRLLGIVHDWGKATPNWQKYLKSSVTRGEITHAPQSAEELFHALSEANQACIAVLLGYAVYGHHSSLPNWTAGLDRIQEAAKKNPRIDFCIPNVYPIATEDLITPLLPELAACKSPEEIPFLIRMLFSALVDADRLDAEHAESPEVSKKRGKYDDWTTLETRFQEAMAKLTANAPDTPINRIRTEIRKHCEEKATQPRGFFTLNVPTGGGKTLSSLAFALKHRAYHKMERIIYAIPFNSIIEQTAQKYKEILGIENVLEHHHNFVLPDDNKYKDLRLKYDLAQENYDMPVIVTTTVQLFESLLQGRASGSRKLHNIANSVIILDEAQKLPPEHLNAVLTSLRVLVKRFGCTVVLCSATIPTVDTAWIGRERNKVQGLPEATAIIKNPEALEKKMKRTRITMLGTQTLAEIAEKMAKEPQSLTIVNTRRRCLELYQMLNVPKKYHLSASMCPAHRQGVLKTIRDELKAGNEVAIVATSLIEAGVDIDVRTVFREIAGVDSIAQAAGRCNREGKYSCGNVYVFATPEALPAGLQSFAANAAFDAIGDEVNPEMNQELYRKYFEHFYVKCAPLLDKDGYRDAFANSLKYQFRDFGENFHMIDDGGQQPLVVLFGEAGKVIAELQKDGPSKAIFRRLSPYTVNIPTKMFTELAGQGLIEEVCGVSVQKSEGIYNPGIGIQSEILSIY